MAVGVMSGRDLPYMVGPQLQIYSSVQQLLYHTLVYPPLHALTDLDGRNEALHLLNSRVLKFLIMMINRYIRLNVLGPVQYLTAMTFKLISWIRRPANPVNNTFKFIFHSFIATNLDGLIQFFLPLVTSKTMLLWQLCRAKGICSITIPILSAVILRSLKADVDLMSAFRFATFFHCIAVGMAFK